jgi:phage gpG-like protein
VDYALLHQLGTKRMPARPFMGFESGDPAAIGKIFSGYIEG